MYSLCLLPAGSSVKIEVLGFGNQTHVRKKVNHLFCKLQLNISGEWVGVSWSIRCSILQSLWRSVRPEYVKSDTPCYSCPLERWAPNRKTLVCILITMYVPLLFGRDLSLWDTKGLPLIFNLPLFTPLHCFSILNFYPFRLFLHPQSDALAVSARTAVAEILIALSLGSAKADELGRVDTRSCSTNYAGKSFRSLEHSSSCDRPRI